MLACLRVTTLCLLCMGLGLIQAHESRHVRSPQAPPQAMTSNCPSPKRAKTWTGFHQLEPGLDAASRERHHDASMRDPGHGNYAESHDDDAAFRTAEQKLDARKEAYHDHRVRMDDNETAHVMDISSSRETPGHLPGHQGDKLGVRGSCEEKKKRSTSCEREKKMDSMCDEAMKDSGEERKGISCVDQNEYLVLHHRVMAELKKFGWYTHDNYVDVPPGRSATYIHTYMYTYMHICIHSFILS
jgi:hypothetical protein